MTRKIYWERNSSLSKGCNIQPTFTYLRLIYSRERKRVNVRSGRAGEGKRILKQIPRWALNLTWDSSKDLEIMTWAGIKGTFNQLCHPGTPKVGTLNLIMENHYYHQPQPNFTEHLLCTDNMLSIHKHYLVQYHWNPVTQVV